MFYNIFILVNYNQTFIQKTNITTTATQPSRKQQNRLFFTSNSTLKIICQYIFLQSTISTKLLILIKHFMNP